MRPSGDGKGAGAIWTATAQRLNQVRKSIRRSKKRKAQADLCVSMLLLPHCYRQCLWTVCIAALVLSLCLRCNRSRTRCSQFLFNSRCSQAPCPVASSPSIGICEPTQPQPDSLSSSRNEAQNGSKRLLGSRPWPPPPLTCRRPLAGVVCLAREWMHMHRWSAPAHSFPDCSNSPSVWPVRALRPLHSPSCIHFPVSHITGSYLLRPPIGCLTLGSANSPKCSKFPKLQLM